MYTVKYLGPEYFSLQWLKMEEINPHLHFPKKKHPTQL